MSLHKFSGRGFEDYVLGIHEMQKFPIKINSSFAANFVNAVVAQPKDHDPAEPKEPRLVKLKKTIERMLRKPIHIYICVGLPIDILHSTDLLIVCWPKRTFVTIDLKTHEDESRAQVKLLPQDLLKGEFELFCDLIANRLSCGDEEFSIRNSTLALLKKTTDLPESLIGNTS